MCVADGLPAAGAGLGAHDPTDCAGREHPAGAGVDRDCGGAAADVRRAGAGVGVVVLVAGVVGVVGGLGDLGPRAGLDRHRAPVGVRGRVRAGLHPAGRQAGVGVLLGDDPGLTGLFLGLAAVLLLGQLTGLALDGALQLAGLPRELSLVLLLAPADLGQREGAAPGRDDHGDGQSGDVATLVTTVEHEQPAFRRACTPPVTRTPSGREPTSRIPVAEGVQTNSFHPCTNLWRSRGHPRQIPRLRATSRAR